MDKTLTVTQQLEKARFEAILETDSGKWLLQELIRQSNALTVFCGTSGGSSASEVAYFKGRHDFVHTFIVQKLIKYFGFAVLDDIMNKELRNG